MKRKNVFLVLGIFFIAIFISRTSSYAGELEDLQSAIRAAGASWIAGETSVSKLPLEGKRKLAGFNPRVSSPQGPVLRAPADQVAALPTSLDWRNIGGNNYVTSIKDQKGCGSCWAHAATAAVESVTLISQGTPNVDFDLSEQILLSCTTGDCEGNFDNLTLNSFLRDTGLPLEDCYPYIQEKGDCAKACPDWQASTYKIKSWIYVAEGMQDQTVEALKYALFTYGPLSSSLFLYEDFYYYKSGVYSHTWGGEMSMHAILIVGYVDTETGGYFIVKNSWGTGWGETGYFRIAYSEVTNPLVNFGIWTTAYVGLPPGCNYSTALSFEASGGSGNIKVTAGDACGWTAASNVEWITVTSGNSGTGSGTASYSVAANTTHSVRTGYLIVAGRGYHVAQEGASCTYSISPNSESFSASGGTGSISVTADSGCNWTAVSNVGWITITSGSSGTGSGKKIPSYVNYSVAANPGSASRTGTLTVAGQSYSVTQEAAAPCTYSISSSSQSLSASGGTGIVSVTAGSGCNWTAVSNVAWITITSGSSGSGNGAVYYSVTANPISASRTGTVTVAGQSLTVAQGGAPCTYSISPTSQYLSASGGTGSVGVTAGGGCNWTAASNAGWITVTSGSSGSGSGAVYYSVTANAISASRTGTLTVAGQSYSVTQEGVPCTYSISPTSQYLSASGGSGSVSVTAGSGCSWTAVSNAGWITITSGSSGSGNGTVYYSVAGNTSAYSRAGTLTIAGQSYTVTQEGAPCSYSISPSSQSLSASGGTGSVSVTAGSGCSWTAASNVNWITITSGSSGSGNGTVYYSVTGNTSPYSRAGTLTIAGQSYTVTQEGAPCTYSISPTTQYLSSSGGTGSVSVTAGGGCSWTAASNVNWITITSGSSGAGNGAVYYSVTANTSPYSRVGTLTVAGQSYSVIQEGVPCTYSISPTSQYLSASGGSGNVSVTAGGGCSWTAVSNVSWITIIWGSDGAGNGAVYYSVAPNTRPIARAGTLTIAGNTVTVTQAGQPVVPDAALE